MNKIRIVNKAVDIISDTILTPVIYMVNTGECLCFICFMSGNMPYERIYAAEKQLSELYNETTAILDIRDFSESERVEVIQNAELIYCADKDIKALIEFNLMNEYKFKSGMKSDLIDRLDNCDSAYIN